MTTTKKTAQAAVEAAALPAEGDQQEVCGVLQFNVAADTHILLNPYALAQVNAALNAIKTCTDLLNSREAERNSVREVCPSVTHGLLAAVQCAAELVRLTVNEDQADGVFKLKGHYAKEVTNTAWKACLEAHEAKRGAA